ncbi:MAG: hypothetical protein WC856_27980, partial [Methylococcaceae bacterium]
SVKNCDGISQTLILPLKFGVNDFYGALQTRNIKAYRTAQMALISDESTSICVARWAYGHAYLTNAQSWLEKGVTVPLDSTYAEILA